MMARTRRATFLPLRMAAAAAMSDKRPLVQLPMTTWSIFTFSAAASSMVFVFSGRWGKATVGRMAERSTSITCSYGASASGAYTVYACCARPSM